MHYEVKTILWVCEFCGKKETVFNTTKVNDPPKGWGCKTVGGFGMGSKNMDCCEECNKKTLKYGKNETYYLEQP